ncbi:hypothetical protein D3C78_782430 [compost metagenome]
MQGAGRGDVEDPAAAVLRHAIADGVAEPGEGEHVELDQLAFARPVLVDEGAGRADAGIVHQQLDLQAVLVQLVHQSGKLQRLGKVAGAEQHVHAEALRQFAGDAFQGIPLACHQNERLATARQGFGQGEADTAGGSGDQGITWHRTSLGERARILTRPDMAGYCSDGVSSGAALSLSSLEP